MSVEALFPLLQLGYKGQRITATGAGTFTPTVTGWYFVRTQAGGGGTGGVKATSGTPILRSGGGGAGECLGYWHLLTTGVAYNYSVGAGGIAGTNAPSDGGTGGNTSFTGPNITQTSIGGTGSQFVSNSIANDGVGGAGGRRDGQTGSGLITVMQGPDCWGGANGGQANTTAGGSAGGFSSPTSASRAGSGASSLWAAGGGGATGVGVGSAGSLGSGAGGSWTASTTGQAGAAGGAGFIEIIFIGKA